VINANPLTNPNHKPQNMCSKLLSIQCEHEWKLALFGKRKCNFWQGHKICNYGYVYYYFS